MKKKTNIASYIAIAIFGLMSVVFLLVGIIGKANVDNFIGTAEKVEGRICDIDTYTTRNSKGKKVTKHKVYVDYTVDDIVYDHIQLDSYNSWMSVGKTIEIYYNPENPRQIMSGDTTAFMIMLCVGAGFTVLTVILLISLIVKGEKQKKLIAEGTAYTGTITDVRVITNIKVNGRHPYKADCEVINPLTQERYLFSSANVYSDIRHLVGAPVVVYMDDNDPSKHFVDIDRAISDYNVNTGTNDFRS